MFGVDYSNDDYISKNKEYDTLLKIALKCKELNPILLAKMANFNEIEVHQVNYLWNDICHKKQILLTENTIVSYFGYKRWTMSDWLGFKTNTLVKDFYQKIKDEYPNEYKDASFISYKGHPQIKLYLDLNAYGRLRDLMTPKGLEIYNTINKIKPLCSIMQQFQLARPKRKLDADCHHSRGGWWSSAFF